MRLQAASQPIAERVSDLGVFCCEVSIEIRSVPKHPRNGYVGCVGEDLSSTVTSQQQTPGSLTLLEIGCRATYSLTRSEYGGVQTQVSTLNGMRHLLLLLVYNIESKHIWHPNTEPNIYFAGYPKYVLHLLLISIRLTSQG